MNLTLPPDSSTGLSLFEDEDTLEYLAQQLEKGPTTQVYSTVQVSGRPPPVDPEWDSCEKNPANC